MQIKPLHTLSRQEVRELAQAAANRGESVYRANPFPNNQNGDRPQYAWFEIEYWEHMRTLDRSAA